MYCPRCGKKIDDGVKVCSDCEIPKEEPKSKTKKIEMSKIDKINRLLMIGLILSFIMVPVGFFISVIGVIRACIYKKNNDEECKNLGLGIAGIVISTIFMISYTIIFIIIINNSFNKYDDYIFGKYNCDGLSPSNIIIENGKVKLLSENEIDVGTYSVNKRKIQSSNYNKCIEYRLNFFSNKTSLDSNIPVNSRNIVIKRCGNITIEFEGYGTFSCNKE